MNKYKVGDIVIDCEKDISRIIKKDKGRNENFVYKLQLLKNKEIIYSLTESYIINKVLIL